MLEMALRAASETAAAGISWTGSALYFLLAQGVAIESTVEIGPNLLSVLTGLIGALVLLGQAYLASRVKKVDEKSDKLKDHVESNAERITEVENGK